MRSKKEQAAVRPIRHWKPVPQNVLLKFLLFYSCMVEKVDWESLSLQYDKMGERPWRYLTVVIKKWEKEVGAVLESFETTRTQVEFLMCLAKFTKEGRPTTQKDVASRPRPGRKHGLRGLQEPGEEGLHRQVVERGRPARETCRHHRKRAPSGRKGDQRDRPRRRTPFSR